MADSKKEKNKYVVDVTLEFTDGGKMFYRKCTPQTTWAVSAKKAESNILYRIGRPIHPITNYSDEYCGWALKATLI